MTNPNEVDVIELLTSGDSEALAAFVASLPEPEIRICDSYQPVRTLTGSYRPPRRASGLFATFGYVRVPSSSDGSEWVAEPYDMDRALFGARLMGTED